MTLHIKLKDNKEYIKNDAVAAVEPWVQIDWEKASEVAKTHDCIVEVVGEYQVSTEDLLRLVEGNKLKIYKNARVVIPYSSMNYVMIECGDVPSISIKTKTLSEVIKICSQIQEEAEDSENTAVRIVVEKDKEGNHITIKQVLDDDYQTQYERFVEAIGACGNGAYNRAAIDEEDNFRTAVGDNIRIRVTYESIYVSSEGSMFEGELKVGRKTAERIFRENRDKCNIVLNTADVPYTQWKTMVENNVNFGILYTAMVSHEVEHNGVSVRIVSHDKGVTILNNRVFTEIARNIETTAKNWNEMVEPWDLQHSE
jgi:hypothetical protein